MDGDTSHIPETPERKAARERRDQLALSMAAADTNAPRGTLAWQRYCAAVSALAQFDEQHPELLPPPQMNRTENR